MKLEKLCLVAHIGFSFCSEVRIACTMSIASLMRINFCCQYHLTLTFTSNLGQHGLNKIFLHSAWKVETKPSMSQLNNAIYVCAQSHGTTDQQEVKHRQNHKYSIIVVIKKKNFFLV